MKIIVTGGYGFIGVNLINQLLLNKNNYILNIDYLNYVSAKNYKFHKFNNHSRYHFSKLDLSNKKKLTDVISKFQPNIIFHLAAESHVDKSIDDPYNFFLKNISSSLSLFEVCKTYIDSYKINKNFKIIHLSTDEIYGSITGNKHSSEKSRFNPSSPYSSSKASVHLMAHSWYTTFGLPINIAIASNNYGPYQHPEKLIPNVINRIINGLPIQLYGNGKNIRNWTYVEDTVKALISIMKFKEVGQEFNIASDQLVSNFDVIQYIMNDNNISKKYQKQHIEYIADRPGHDFRYSLSSKKFNMTFNKELSIDFKNGIKKTIKWYLENNDWLKIINKNFKFIREGTIE